MRELFLHDLRWKLFSLFLALAIWGTVHKILNSSGQPADTSDNSKVSYSDLPVQPVSSSADVHFYRVAPDTVKVIVTGSKEAIATLQANQIRVTANLTGFDPVKDFKADVEVSVPPGITLINVDPPIVGVHPPSAP